MRALVILAVLAVTARVAAADPIIAYADDPNPPASYTSELIASDVLSIGAFLLGGHFEGANGEDTRASTALFAVGMIGYEVGGPTIHGVHRQGGRAAASFLIRQVLPTAGLLIKVHMNRGCDDTHDWFCELDGIGPWFIGGMVAASALDIAVFTHGDVLANHKTHARTWAPVVAPTASGATFGAVGSF